MFIPSGFTCRSIFTTLGKVVYYTAQDSPWMLQETEFKELPETTSPETTSKEPEETLVFLHGFGGGSSAYEWSKVYPAFAAEYRILAPDLIGWGRSDHPVRDYQIQDYISTIIEFLEKTCQGPATVIASALTAAFTLRAATQRPELFKSLILTTAAGLADFGHSYRNSSFAQFARSANYPFVNQLLYGTGVANRLGIRSFLESRQFARPERIYPEIVEAYLMSAQRRNAEYAALSFVRGDLCFDLSLYVTKLSVPTAIIWGEGAEFTQPETGRHLASLNPQAIRIFHQLSDVGFTPQLELPAVTIGLIRKFLPLLC